MRQVGGGEAERDEAVLLLVWDRAWTGRLLVLAALLVPSMLLVLAARSTVLEGDLWRGWGENWGMGPKWPNLEV